MTRTSIQGLETVFDILFKDGKMSGRAYNKITHAIVGYRNEYVKVSSSYSFSPTKELGVRFEDHNIPLSPFKKFLTDLGAGETDYPASYYQILFSLGKQESDARMSSFRTLEPFDLSAKNVKNRKAAYLEITKMKERAFNQFFEFGKGEAIFPELIKLAKSKRNSVNLAELREFNKLYNVPIKRLKHSNLGPSHEFLALKALRGISEVFAIEVPVWFVTQNGKLFKGHIDLLSYMDGDTLYVFDYKPNLRIFEKQRGQKVLAGSFVNAIPQVGGYALSVKQMFGEALKALGVKDIKAVIFNKEGCVIFDPEWAVAQSIEIYAQNMGDYPIYKDLLNWVEKGGQQYPEYALEHFLKETGQRPLLSDGSFSEAFKDWYLHHYSYVFVGNEVF